MLSFGRVKFVFITGLRREVFRNVRLTGSWDAAGRFVDDADKWSVTPMETIPWEDGGFAYQAEVPLATDQAERTFRWSVLVDGADVRDARAVVTEIDDAQGTGAPALERRFVPAHSSGAERYHLSFARRLGAQKIQLAGAGEASLRFSVWAPNAEAVEVVFGRRGCGYIADDGTGIDPDRPVIPLVRGDTGLWQSNDTDQHLARFADWVGVPYMFRVRKEGGAIAYRTDLYARAQIGTGAANPHGEPWPGTPEGLDGVVSCSVVVDPDAVARDFVPPGDVTAARISEEEFWRDEFRHDRPVPQRLEDLVIYELHLGSLGFGQQRPGNLGDAMGLLDYLEDLGINAVELLPVAEFGGNATWGYGNSHHFAVEGSAGGRDQLKHFVRECHRRGIAVLVDVVYNHYVHDGERAQWHYDSNREEHNIYFWYEGRAEDYAEPGGGYVDNMSTGWAPRFSEEMVRRMFISSALALIDEFHVDGFRVDQTTSIHGYNVLHADGRPLGNVNVAGARFLREYSRTMKLVRPATFLIAEDHSNWPLVKERAEFVGLGFDAAWYADYYHHLIGDTDKGEDYAKLLFVAGHGDDTPVRMDYFAGALGATGRGTVVYHESHDEAGNSPQTRRTLSVALNLPAGAVPEGDVRHYAEERCRFVAAVTLFSAGTPMFLFGEEVGAVKPFRYDDFLDNREDLLGDRNGAGRCVFEFYKDAIRLRLRYAGLRSPEIEVVHAHNDARVIAFRRFRGAEEYLVIGTLANTPHDPYVLEHPLFAQEGSVWREIFNTDSARYGGAGVDNPEPISAADGKLSVRIPARAVIVLRRGPG
jgi:1,4-alpha-glucan branching enzyme